MSLARAAVRAALDPRWVSDSLWRRAQQVPAFDLDFTSRSIVDRIGGITPTFTRAGVPKVAWGGSEFISIAANEVAFQPAADGVIEYLQEGSAINEIPRNIGSTAGWVGVATTTATVSAVGVIGPETYYQFRETTANSEHYFEYQFGKAGSTGAWTHSCVVRPVGATRWAWLRPISTADGNSTSSLIVDFQLGTTSLNGSNPGATVRMERLGSSGWWLIQITNILTGSNTSNNWRIHARSATNTISYAGNPADGLDIYAPQAEAGYSATSRIFTTGAAATRGADSMVITGTDAVNLFSRPEYTLYMEYTPYRVGSQQFIVGADNSGTAIGADEIRFGENNGGGRVASIDSGAVSQYNNFTQGNVSPGVLERRAFAIRLNDTTTSSRGQTRPATDVICTPTSGIDRFRIGGRANLTFMAHAGIRRVALFPSRISDSLLDTMVA